MGDTTQVWKRISRAGAIAAMAFAATACGGVVEGSGRYVEDVRDATAFAGVSAADGLEVVAIAGTEPSIRVYGDDDLVAALRTEVREGTLYVEMAPEAKAWASRYQLRVYVGTPAIDRISASGENTKVVVRELAAERLDVVASGDSTVVASGRADTLVVQASDAAVVNLSELAATNARITASDSGVVDARVSDALYVDLSGGARLRLDGKPALGGPSKDTLAARP